MVRHRDSENRPARIPGGRSVLRVRLMLVAAAGCLAVGGSAATSGNATAGSNNSFDSAAFATKGAHEGPPLSGEELTTQNEQMPYMELGEKIFAIASSDPESSLAGTGKDIANHRMTVYWVGPVPEELLALQKSARDMGIDLAVMPARFSEKQLMSIATRLAKSAGQPGGLTVGLSPDGSSLTVDFPGLPAAVHGTRTVEQARLLDAIDAIRATTGVRVEIQDETLEPHVASRSADYNPYWGGAIAQNSSGVCTDGFSMHASGSDAHFLLSVAHCSSYGDGFTTYNGAWDRSTNGATTRIGVTDFVNELFYMKQYDLSVIREDYPKSNQPYFYVAEDTGYRVVAYATDGIPPDGNYCAAGAVTPTHCRVISDGQHLICPAGAPGCWWAINVHSMDGNNIFCHGDSGGPIYYNSSSGRIAAGVISGVYGLGRCEDTGFVSVVRSAIANINGLVLTTS